MNEKYTIQLYGSPNKQIHTSLILRDGQRCTLLAGSYIIDMSTFHQMWKPKHNGGELIAVSHVEHIFKLKLLKAH